VASYATVNSKNYFLEAARVSFPWVLMAAAALPAMSSIFWGRPVWDFRFEQTGACVSATNSSMVFEHLGHFHFDIPDMDKNGTTKERGQ
jgi:hypothetical protein